MGIARMHLGDVPLRDGDVALGRYRAFCDAVQNTEGGVSVLFLGTVSTAKLIRMGAALATFLPAVARFTEQSFAAVPATSTTTTLLNHTALGNHSGVFI